MSKGKLEIGFFNYAHSYCISGRALQKSRVEATHPDAVIRYLYYHAIELYLKAFLLSQGLNEENLRKKEFGHKIEKLAKEAKNNGLNLSDTDQEIFEKIGNTDNIISSRYIRLGAHELIAIEALYGICFHLHGEILEFAYSSVSGKRRPILETPNFEELKRLDISRNVL